MQQRKQQQRIKREDASKERGRQSTKTKTAGKKRSEPWGKEEGKKKDVEQPDPGETRKSKAPVGQKETGKEAQTEESTCQKQGALMKGGVLSREKVDLKNNQSSQFQPKENKTQEKKPNIRGGTRYKGTGKKGESHGLVMAGLKVIPMSKSGGKRVRGKPSKRRVHLGKAWTAVKKQNRSLLDKKRIVRKKAGDLARKGFTGLAQVI